MSTIDDAGAVAPDLIVPLVGFRQWRLTAGALESMYDGSSWPEVASPLGATGGTAPTRCRSRTAAAACTRYYDPCPRTASAATPDLIGGALVVWGKIEAHMYGMRGKHAGIVALELPLSRGRKRRAVIEVANLLGVPAVPHRSLKTIALEHGEVLRPALRPKKTLTRAANVWARNGPLITRTGQRVVAGKRCPGTLQSVNGTKGAART